MSNLIKQLKKLDLELKENEPLKKHTTFKIGGPAKIFLKIKNYDDLVKVLKIIKENNLNYFLIGGGSNLLVNDKGFNGVVIKICFKEITINSQKVKISADYSLASLINKTLNHGLTGLEFATGIPGTIGGSIKGNAGTFGKAMNDVVESVDFLDNNLKLQTMTNKNCNFSYRHSIFKENESWVIISATLKLKKTDIKASKKLMRQRMDYRLKNHPQGFPNAGSTFKNVIYSQKIIQKLQAKGWQIPASFKEHQKIPAGWIIENLDLKGKIIGQAQISPHHANHLINLGQATADEVIQLISLIKTKVRDEVGIQLEEEVRYVGF